MLPHMTTPNTARDLDVIRAALGEKKLNFLGVSYGTYIGAVYGTLFPNHVRRMVVDSVVNPSREKIWYEANLDQDVAFEGRWNDWTEVGRRRTTRPTTSATPAPPSQAKWLELRATAKKSPLGGRRRPGRADRLLPERPVLRLLVGARSPPCAASTSPVTPRRWSTPPPRTCRTPRATPASENGNAVYTAVECTDAKWPTSWKKWDRDNTQLHKNYPFMTWSNAWMNLPCATWPVKQQHPGERQDAQGPAARADRPVRA